MKKLFAGIVAATLLLSTPLSVSATAPKVEPTVLTLDLACKIAQENSVEYKNLVKQLETNQDKLDDMNEATPTVNKTSTKLIDEGIARRELELKIETQKKNEQIKRDSLRLSIMKQFNTIISAQKALELYDKSQVNSALDEKILDVKFKLGMLSQTTFDAQKTSYAKSRDDRKNKVTAIDNAFISLCKLLGRPIDSKFTISPDYTYTYTPITQMSEFELYQYGSFAIGDSPDMKSKRLAVIAAQEKVDLVTAYELAYDEELDSLKDKLNNATRTLSDADAQFRLNLTNLYKSILDAEKQYEDNQTEYLTMLKNLEIKEVQYTLGKATSLDIAKYKQQITQFEETIRTQIIDHELKVWQFNHPDQI